MVTIPLSGPRASNDVERSISLMDAEVGEVWAIYWESVNTANIDFSPCHKACHEKKEKKPIFSFSINIDIQYKAGLRGYIAFLDNPLLQSQFNGIMKTFLIVAS